MFIDGFFEQLKGNMRDNLKIWKSKARGNEARNGKGQRHLKGLRRFTPPRSSSSLARVSSLMEKERERERHGRQPTVAGNQPSPWQLHPDEYRLPGQKGWRCGYESENNLIRKRAVPFPFALATRLSRWMSRSVTSRRVKRPPRSRGRGDGYWWRGNSEGDARYCAKHRTKGTTINNSCYSGETPPRVSKITRCAATREAAVAQREAVSRVYSEFARHAIFSVLMRTPFPRDSSFDASNWLERIGSGHACVK